MEQINLLNPLRKWWWLILVSTLSAALVSYFVTSQQQPVYRSHATLIVGQVIDDPNPTGSEFATGQQLATTYADIAQREPVQRAVAQELGLASPPRYTVINLPRTQLLEITVVDANPDRAMAIADAVANEIIALSPGTTQQDDQGRQDFVGAQLDSLQERIAETEDLLQEKQAELADLFGAQQIQDAQNEINALEAKLNTLQGNFAALLASTQQNALNTVSFIEPATRPLGPVDPQRGMTVVIAASVGFFLSAGAAYVMEFLDRAIRTAKDVSRITEMRIVGTIPRLSKRRYESKLVASRYPRSPVSESYRSLRTVIRPQTDGDEGNVILLTSLNKSDGKSVTAGNLAVVFAQAGMRVLLVDANLRRPSLHVLFALENGKGVSDMLSQNRDTDPWSEEVWQTKFNALVRVFQPNLDIITSGSKVERNAAELVGSERMGQFLAQARRRYDVILVDSPPCLFVPDALDLSNFASSVLLVVRSGAASPDELRDALAMLDEVGANVVGIVLNNVVPEKRGYFYGRRYVVSEKKNLRGRILGQSEELSEQLPLVAPDPDTANR